MCNIGIIYWSNRVPNLNFLHIKTMQFVIDSIFQLFIVGVLWGSTNPFLKAATNKVKRNKTFNIISEIVDHVTNWHVSNELWLISYYIINYYL